MVTAMQNKCEECLNSKPVISENGFHKNCTLSYKKAMDCLLGIKDSFIKNQMQKDGDRHDKA